MRIQRAAVVYKKSAWEMYNASRDDPLKAFMQREDNPDVKRMKESHQRQKESLRVLQSALRERGINYNLLYRCNAGAITDVDLAISAGGDGTALEAARHLNGVPLLAYNTDPLSSTGFYCSANAENIRDVLQRIGEQPTTDVARLETEVARLEVLVNEVLLPGLVLNDVLFAHSNPAATTRYVSTIEGDKSIHKNSGFLVCAEAGSTAWMYEEGREIKPFNSGRMQYLHRGQRVEKPKITSTT